ncbi:MAG: membrane protein [Desulfobulbaceae bacterium BRH_c16a]|nr:MAG: membrane protein [Desulfobulbaceae bacterium BRH_c16a]
MINLRAYLACIFIVFAWSGWITISRYGVHTALQPADITLIRYATAMICVSPLIVRHRWARFKLHQYLIMGLGIGFPYTMMTFYGLRVLKAAHAGVLVNGMLPVLGAVAAWFILRQRVSIVRYVAIGLIFLANFIMAGGDTFSTDHSVGILLLLSAAVCYTTHMIGVRLWRFEWRDVLVAVPVVNTLIFLPLWFVFPTALFEAELHEILIQAGYQGIIVNIVALMFSTYAISRLGTITVSIFMSFVPVGTAILAWLLLGETLNSWELCGIIGCSIGLFIYAWGQTWENRKRTLH